MRQQTTGREWVMAQRNGVMMPTPLALLGTWEDPRRKTQVEHPRRKAQGAGSG
jgi:hypothetical protein